MLQGDDRIQLRVTGRREVVILGYQGEPYLRFSAKGVFRNERSPATFLNEERYGGVQVPEQADARATPVWRSVAPAGRAHDWHDHRIHWMSRSDPPLVVASRDQPHHVFDWTIPGTIGGEPLAIAGSLDYAPLPGQHFPRVLLVPLVLLALAGLAMPLLRRRDRTRRGHSAPPGSVDGEVRP